MVKEILTDPYAWLFLAAMWVLGDFTGSGGFRGNSRWGRWGRH